MFFSTIVYVDNSDFIVTAASSKSISINQKPTVKSSNIKSTSVKLKWSKTKNATSYRIYRSTNKKKWTLVAKTKKTSFTVKSLNGNKKYYFKVRAYNSKGKKTKKSPYSKVITVKTKKNETVYTTKNVKIRAKASSNSKSLGTLKKSKSIKRTGTKNSWSKVIYNGKVGYIKTKYLTNKKPTVVQKKEYDTVLAYGDGYYLVKKDVETYNSATTKYGVIDENGNWVCPLTDYNYFAICAEVAMESGYNKSYGTLSFSYMNEGFFLVKVYCALVEEGGIPSGYEATYSSHCRSYIVRYDGELITSGKYLMTKYYNGYCFATDSGGDVIRIDREGEKTYIATRYKSHQFGYDKLAVPSCGLIYCNRAFYNIKNGEMAIDLSEYNLTNNERGMYSFDKDGTFTFTFYNPNRTVYIATIDKKGNFVKEPTKY